MSILPVYAAFVVLICLALMVRAWRIGALTRQEAFALCGLLAALIIWSGIVMFLGLNGTHVRLMPTIPFLWQAFVPMMIWMVPFGISVRFRQALLRIAVATPAHWLVLIQALRIGAIGGIMKGLKGQIRSDYVFWIGIPDFLFGLSALGVAWLVWRDPAQPRLLISWNLVGFALIVFPTFIPMAYWMNEPGFEFIFEFPMVLAPSFVVSVLISLNLLQLWSTSNKKSPVA